MPTELIIFVLGVAIGGVITIVAVNLFIIGLGKKWYVE